MQASGLRLNQSCTKQDLALFLAAICSSKKLSQGCTINQHLSICAQASGVKLGMQASDLCSNDLGLQAFSKLQEIPHLAHANLYEDVFLQGGF